MKEDTLKKAVLRTRVTLIRTKGNKRIHHAHAAKDDEPSKKRTRYESEDSSSEDEYVLILALIGNITHGSDDWLMDIGGFQSYDRIQGILCKTVRT